MTKKVLFIGMVVLMVASAANAGIGWGVGWLWGFVAPLPTPPGGQAQVGYATGGSAVTHYGTGVTSSPSQTKTWTNTQSRPFGTQSSSVTVGHSGYVSGLTPYSYGQSYSQSQVSTFQYQQVY